MALDKIPRYLLKKSLPSMAHESREEKPRVPIVSGFYYSDLSSLANSTIPQLENQMQGFEPNPEIFNMQSGTEMEGLSWKNQQQRDRNSVAWKGYLSKPSNNQASSSTSKSVAEHSTDFYESDIQKSDFGAAFSGTPNENLIIGPDSAWQENRILVDDSSFRCVFPCEGNERPSHGLSLSLCPNESSTIGLQSFELRETNHQNDIRFFSSNSGVGFYGKSMDFHQQQQQPQNSHHHQQQQQLKNSKFLLPTQELLYEFCNLGTKQKAKNSKNKFHKSNQWEYGVSSKNQSLYSFDFLELQKRKGKLVSMLEEVDRRYRQYCEQMRGVVSCFEMVAGEGAASVYSTLALRAMSRHFRCLRDGIVVQIQATKTAMGEKDPVAPGTTRGETPRLRLLERSLRQPKTLQHMGMIESHPWKPQRGLPERSVSVLRAWLFEHFLHPYPSDVDKHILARQTGLSRSQVSNWFINARVRLWKPMVEEMYVEENKEQENKASDGVGMPQDNSRPSTNPNPNSTHETQRHLDDQKPPLDQLIHDSEALSSIINNSDKRGGRDIKGESHQQQNQFARAENFGAVDLDFSSYTHADRSVTYTNSNGTQPNFGNGVSLTLGLQQNNGGGVNLSFSPTTAASAQHSLFISRQQMEECPPIQYSILDGEAQNLPYRNLMGAQLLHDFAG